MTDVDPTDRPPPPTAAQADAPAISSPPPAPLGGAGTPLPAAAATGTDRATPIATPTAAAPNPPRIWLRTLLAIAIALGAWFATFRLPDLLELHRDVRATADLAQGPSMFNGEGTPHGAATHPLASTVPFIAGLTASDEVVDGLPVVFRSCWPPEGDRLPLPILRAGLRHREIPPGLAAEIARRTLARIDRPASSSPNCCPYDIRIDTSLQMIEAARTQRLWLSCGRILAADGQTEAATLILLGSLLMVNELEAFDPRGLPLMTRYLSALLREHAASVWLDALPDLPLDRQSAIATAQRLAALEQALAPMRHAFEFEQNRVRSLVWELHERVRRQTASTTYGRQLLHLDQALSTATVDASIDEHYQSIMAAIALPYPAMKPRLAPIRQETLAFQARVDRGWHPFLYYWRPELELLEGEIAGEIPDVSEILVRDVLARQKLRGVAVALVMSAFARDQGRWPATLADLATWTGPDWQPPTDLFADAPLTWTASPTPRLFSVGPDAMAGTPDDIVFIPVIGNPPAGESEPEASRTLPTTASRPVSSQATGPADERTRGSDVANDPTTHY